MQEGIRGHVGGEVLRGVTQELYVAEVHRGGQGGLDVAALLNRGKDKEPRQKGEAQDKHCGRKESPSPTGIKLDEAYGAVRSTSRTSRSVIK